MRRGLAAALALAMPVCMAGSIQPPVTPDLDGWQTFGGRLTATGRGATVPMETGALATSVQLSGSLIITGDDHLRRGFHVEALGFEDMAGSGVGRAVWTDDAGDRVFSRIVGMPVVAGRSSSAVITGGTGRYAGITGSYTFTWQYVLSGEHGEVHARTTSLSGRFRREPPR